MFFLSKKKIMWFWITSFWQEHLLPNPKYAGWRVGVALSSIQFITIRHLVTMYLLSNEPYHLSITWNNKINLKIIKKSARVYLPHTKLLWWKQEMIKITLSGNDVCTRFWITSKKLANRNPSSSKSTANPSWHLCCKLIAIRSIERIVWNNS